MGFFNNIFTSQPNTPKESFPWKELRLMDQLQAIVNDSKDRSQVIFKHSTSCGISRMVLRQFESQNKELEGSVDFYFLDIFANRPLSNELASIFGVRHESPQLLCIKKGSVIFHASHGAINDIPLEKYR
ncbi:MAG: bacillithiol system redox-active protein YtxJ [Flavobacteriaceae bacterium]|nr:bacillithiol system redox-active protein YtxJ [Flavobacteriaceae bacterium]